MKKLGLALAMGLLATSALAQDKTVDLKISIWLPPAHALVPATKEWAALIEKASGGTIKTAIFPSEQLGKAFDHYDMARDGIADFAYINPGYQPAASRSWPVRRCPSCSPTARAARRRSTSGIASTPPRR